MNFSRNQIFNFKVCRIKPFISGFGPNPIEHRAKTGRLHCLLHSFSCVPWQTNPPAISANITGTPTPTPTPKQYYEVDLWELHKSVGWLSTAVQQVYNPFHTFVSQVELYSQLHMSHQSDPSALGVPISTLWGLVMINMMGTFLRSQGTYSDNLIIYRPGAAEAVLHTPSSLNALQCNDEVIRSVTNPLWKYHHNTFTS